VVKVRVVEVDVKRKRIALSMRKDGGEAPPPGPRGGDRDKPVNPKFAKTDSKPSQGAFGAALAEAMKRR